MSNNKQQHLSCVARGNGFIPVADATYFIDNEPVHTGLFEMIGDSLQPVRNTDTSLRVRTCVLRERHPDIKGDRHYRAIEDVFPPTEGNEDRYVGIFESYEDRIKGSVSMPVTLTCFTPVHVFKTDKGPDQYYGAAARAKRAA